MRAARYYGKGDIRIDEVAQPALSFDDEVIVSVNYCGVCGTDLHEYAVGPIVTCTQPHPHTGAMLPQILGHEFSATVVEIGRSVREVSVGDRVSVMPAIICGRCEECRTGRGHLCRLYACTGLSAETGGLGQFAVLKEYQVSKLPESVSDMAGAVIEPAAVAANGVERVGIRGGDTVLVTGAGPIGALTAMYANAVGAGLVVFSEPNPQRAVFATGLGIGPVVDPRDENIDHIMANLTDGRGFDVSMECSGSNPGLIAAIQYTRRSGRVGQTGLHTKPAEINAMQVSEKDLTIVGNWCYGITDWPRVIRLVASGKYPIEKVVTSVIDLDDVVAKGFEVLLDPNGDQMKVLVKVNE